MASAGVSSPPPPPPSPPPFHADEPEPPSTAELFAASRVASQDLVADYHTYAALQLEGIEPGEPPVNVDTPLIKSVTFRTIAASLPGSTLSLPLASTGAIIHVTIPQSSIVRELEHGSARSWVLVPPSETVDVLLTSWGLDIHAWRLEHTSTTAYASQT